mgnify:CR=1 FL=1
MIFLIIYNSFWLGAKQKFCFSEIYYLINQSGIPYLSIIHIMASGNFIREGSEIEEMGRYKKVGGCKKVWTYFMDDHEGERME